MRGRTLIQLENRLDLTPTATSEVLGVAYSTYCQYRRNTRTIPPYVARHVELMLLLPTGLLKASIATIDGDIL